MLYFLKYAVSQELLKLNFEIRLNYFKVLEAVDEVGYLTNIRYSKINKHHTLKQIKLMEPEITSRENSDANDSNQSKQLIVKKSLRDISKIN